MNDFDEHPLGDDAFGLLAEKVVAADVGGLQTGKALAMYLFFSFDLVGSTRLKTRRFPTYSWIAVVKRFYELIDSTLRGEFKIESAHRWKFVGDEVLYFVPLTRRREIGEIVDAVFGTLASFDEELKNGEFYEAAKDLSIKAVSWIAPVRMDADDPTATMLRFDAYRSRFIGDDELIYPDGDRTQIPDFLGPNIDAGFRIATFARKRQLVVSPALALYLLRREGAHDRLRIVGFDKLKGVAAERLYPAVWYSRDEFARLEETFDYEERQLDDLVVAAFTQRFDIALLERDVMPAFRELGYFFDPNIVEEIIEGAATGG